MVKENRSPDNTLKDRRGIRHKTEHCIRNPIREIQRKYPIDWVAGEPYTLKGVRTVLGRGMSETANESWYGVLVPIS